MDELNDRIQQWEAQDDRWRINDRIRTIGQDFADEQAFMAPLLVPGPHREEEKNSIAIANHESFSGWTKTFTDPRLCIAIVDRRTFSGTIIETDTDSYRLAHTKQRLT